MLRLEKLEVSGFKSFADRTELHFDDGVTAVVGPNGCGKSNIADAIAWVLGEQSAKSLRSSKMEDVIFNGSRDRKPLGMAEVSLFFEAKQDITNEDLLAAELVLPEPPVIEGLDAEPGTEGEPQTLETAGQSPQPESEGLDADPIKKPHRRHVYREAKPPRIASGEKLVVTRRLYRTGESDYLLNGKSTRLRDIQQLFAGTGLSGAHYAIIEQGDIDRVLSSKPQERRAIIEEAAGVSIFRIKKRAAELRLESGRQNLSRLSDIISEIERQVGSLKRQAARARRYRRLREQLRAVQANVFSGDAKRIEAQLNLLAEGGRSLLDELAASEQQLGGQERRLSESNALARSLEVELDQRRRALSKLETEIERTRSTRVTQSSEIAHTQARIAEVEREHKASVARFELADRHSDVLRRQAEALDAEARIERDRLAELSAEYERSLDRLQIAEQQIEELRQQHYSAINHADRLGHGLAQHEEFLKKSDLRRRQLDLEHGRTTERRTAAAAAVELLSNELDATHASLGQLITERRTKEILHDEAKKLAQTRQKSYDSVLERQTSLTHRLESLEELNACHSYYNEAVQQILQGTNGRYVAIGTVADFLNVAPEYEELVENFLGDILQCVLVPTARDAMSALSQLGGESGGRATFLVTGLQGGEGPRLMPVRVSPVIGEVAGAAPAPEKVEGIAASELLQIKQEMAPLFEAAFPEEWKAVMAGTLERAIELSLRNPFRLYVSSKGETVKSGRVIRGGSSKPSGRGLLALRREIADLRAETEKCELSVREAEAESERAGAVVAGLTEGITRLDSGIQELERQIFEKRIAADHFSKEIERADQQLRIVSDELQQLSLEDEGIAEEMAAARVRIGELEAVRAEREAALTAERERFQLARTSAIAQSEELGKLRAQVATSEERRRSLAADLKRLDQEHDDLEQKISQFRFEELEARERVSSLELETVRLEAALKSLESTHESEARAIEELNERLLGVRQQSDALDLSLKTLRQKTSELKERRSAMDVERARFETEAGHIRQSCETELGLELDTLLTTGLPVGSDGREVPAIQFEENETPRDRLNDIRRKLDELGPVNMVALDELTEAEERYHFLTTQRDDVLKSINGTDQALAEIKRRSRRRFLEAFEAINERFKQTFAELFGGGRGEMILLDQEDVLESGIEIIAQPPGKRLQNVLLLSGGEKALSAIALILAIFKHHPSPFCLMDEVDAALDEMNVGRFCDKILQLTRDTQFIVITHTKRTMEAAKAIYGVTMEEPGVSKLLSVRFS